MSGPVGQKMDVGWLGHRADNLHAQVFDIPLRCLDRLRHIKGYVLYFHFRSFSLILLGLIREGRKRTIPLLTTPVNPNTRTASRQLHYLL
jgi:hypothetical protein